MIKMLDTNQKYENLFKAYLLIVSELAEELDTNNNILKLKYFEQTTEKNILEIVDNPADKIKCKDKIITVVEQLLSGWKKLKLDKHLINKTLDSYFELLEKTYQDYSTD
jgi:hypothetical protein